MWIEHENRIINLQLVTDIDIDGCVIDFYHGDGLVSEVILQNEKTAKEAFEKIKTLLKPVSI